MAHATLQRYAQELLVVSARIDITVGEAIAPSVIDAVANHWTREQHHRHRAGSLRWARELFVQTATDWLRFLGRLEVPQPKIVPLRVGLLILPHTGEMNAVYPQPPSVVRTGMWRSAVGSAFAGPGPGQD